jgi:hypothetical protein
MARLTICSARAPLVLDDDAMVPEELRAAYRVLKNSGYVPAEVEALRDLRAQASHTQAQLCRQAGLLSTHRRKTRHAPQPGAVNGSCYRPVNTSLRFFMSARRLLPRPHRLAFLHKGTAAFDIVLAREAVGNRLVGERLIALVDVFYVFVDHAFGGYDG